ncbi:UNVERIFIED_ORG: putative Rossmann fold flavoprotein [Pantoea brenneri]|nr:putative Rossmann fold flavoprotein [Pantoea brenneri]
MSRSLQSAPFQLSERVVVEQFDVIIIGAGAAGLFCAAQAGQRGRRVLLLDNGKKPGRKILMSGGGRCNFTNLYTEPAAYLSHNPHFCKSALARYTQWDFIDLVNRHGIAWHEKTLGQLFCDDSAQQIVDLLLAECDKGNVTLRLRSEVLSVVRDESGFTLQLNGSTVQAEKLVIASGGLSMPGLGATPFGYKIAEQFGLSVFPTRAAPGAFYPAQAAAGAVADAVRRRAGDHYRCAGWHPLQRGDAVYPPRPLRPGGVTNLQLLATRRIRHHRSVACHAA